MVRGLTGSATSGAAKSEDMLDVSKASRRRNRWKRRANWHASATSGAVDEPTASPVKIFRFDPAVIVHEVLDDEYTFDNIGPDGAPLVSQTSRGTTQPTLSDDQVKFLCQSSAENYIIAHRRACLWVKGVVQTLGPVYCPQFQGRRVGFHLMPNDDDVSYTCDDPMPGEYNTLQDIAVWDDEFVTYQDYDELADTFLTRTAHKHDGSEYLPLHRGHFFHAGFPPQGFLGGAVCPVAAGHCNWIFDTGCWSHLTT